MRNQALSADLIQNFFFLNFLKYASVITTQLFIIFSHTLTQLDCWEVGRLKSEGQLRWHQVNDPVVNHHAICLQWKLQADWLGAAATAGAWGAVTLPPPDMPRVKLCRSAALMDADPVQIRTPDEVPGPKRCWRIIEVLFQRGDYFTSLNCFLFKEITVLDWMDRQAGDWTGSVLSSHPSTAAMFSSESNSRWQPLSSSECPLMMDPSKFCSTVVWHTAVGTLIS